MTSGRSSGRTRTRCLPGGPRWVDVPSYADHRRTQGQTASTVPQAAVVCGARTAPSTVRDRWAWHGNAAKGMGRWGKTTTTPPHKRWPLHVEHTSSSRRGKRGDSGDRGGVPRRTRGPGPSLADSHLHAPRPCPIPANPATPAVSMCQRDGTELSGPVRARGRQRAPSSGNFH